VPAALGLTSCPVEVDFGTLGGVNDVSVRMLESADWAVLRELRLGALQDSPAAFYSTYERERDRDETAWRAWPQRGVAFGAWIGDAPVGMVVVMPDEDQPELADVFAMWVAPGARGSGAADALILAAVEWATVHGCDSVGLEVAPGNTRAERVYARHGFVVTDEKSIVECGLVMRRKLECRPGWRDHQPTTSAPPMGSISDTT
jgi:ribosomal protein S18 acetylase RimI-like enzyme